MAKKKAAPVVNTTTGSAAYALAVQYEAQIGPRLPASMIPNLAADLTTLGAPPAPATPPATTPPATPATPPPTLAQALTTAANLVSAIRESILGSKAKQAVRTAYGISSRGAPEEAKAVLATAGKIVAQATEDASQAMALGILPADVTALQAAITALEAAQAAAETSAGKVSGTTGAQRRAAEARMHEATAKIAGVGTLAFAANTTVRAQFEALKTAKKKK
jgi:hypothetical protein